MTLFLSHCNDVFAAVVVFTGYLLSLDIYLHWILSRRYVSPGAGLSTVVISFLLTTYYNVIMAWALFYLAASFTAELPWEQCDHSWNSAQVSVT